MIYYVGLKHETLYFQIQFMNLLCSSEDIKVIKSKVALERGLNFQKQNYAINAELKKKNHQSKLYAQNKSSVTEEEKLTKMKTELKFSKRKCGKDHISFAQFVIDVFIQGLCSFFLK